MTMKSMLFPYITNHTSCSCGVDNRGQIDFQGTSWVLSCLIQIAFVFHLPMLKRPVFFKYLTYNGWEIWLCCTIMEKARRSYNSLKELFLPLNIIVQVSMNYVLWNTRTEIVVLSLLCLWSQRHHFTVLKLLFENINSRSLKGSLYFYFMLYAFQITE